MKVQKPKSGLIHTSLETSRSSHIMREKCVFLIGNYGSCWPSLLAKASVMHT